MKSTHIVGVDLGQQRDYTAINVTERVAMSAGVPVGEPIPLVYRVRHLERPALGTPYPEIVEHVVKLVKRIGGSPVLVVDSTGVGRPVVEMLYQALGEGLRGSTTHVTPCWVTITGGDSVTRGEVGWRVPKRDLVSAALVLLQNGRLTIAESLRLRETLVRELLNFRVKINIATAHDSYEAWREGDHDDLVLSVALSCWAGERFLKKPQKQPSELPWALR